MVSSSFIPVALASLGICAALLFNSCRSIPKEEKQAEKLQMAIEKEEEKAYQARKKEHLQMQSKETLKMMRDMEKRSRQLNKSRKR